MASGTEGGAWVGLGDAVEGIRAELARAREAGLGEDLRFEVGPVEVELATEFRTSADGKVGAKVWVAELGASGGASSGATHRIKLMLNPVDARTGKAPYVGDALPTPPPRPPAG